MGEAYICLRASLHVSVDGVSVELESMVNVGDRARG